MRIAFLTWRDSGHPDGGGSEVFVERVACELASRGHEVTIRCARYPGAAAVEDRAGVRLERTGGRLGVYPRGLLWLWRRRREVDVVVDVINGVPFGAPLVRRRGVVALVHHVHREQWRMIYPGLRGRIGWFVEHRVTPWLYRGVEHLTVSEASRADLVAIGVPAQRIHLARNGVDVVRVAAGTGDVPRICVLSRLVPHKQIEHAFALVERLLPDHPRIGLDVVGEGWWRPELEADLRRRRVADAVSLHGWLPPEERDRLLAQAWVALLPSVKEGWGLAVMEAASQGTPTVAYRSAGGVAEAIDDGVSGLLVADLEEMVDVVGRLMTDRSRCVALGEAAARRARSFSWGDTADAVEAVLHRAITGR